MERCQRAGDEVDLRVEEAVAVLTLVLRVVVMVLAAQGVEVHRAGGNKTKLNFTHLKFNLQYFPGHSC